METLHSARVTTIGALKRGEQGYAHPIYVYHEQATDRYWIHPHCPVYDAPAIGALIQRGRKGYTVQIVHGRDPSPWNEPGCPSEHGYIPAYRCIREDWY